MCCFSAEVISVAETRIFGRMLPDGRQAIVYQMNYEAESPLAMILPIPVPTSSSEDAVKFVSLEKYPKFFADMKAGFPLPKSRAFAGGGGLGGIVPEKVLKVHEVGSFVASFVPTVAEFKRLDEQFRLPADVWEQLPQYADYGFAVFQLKPEKSTVHPLAFTMPTRLRAKLFLPTVHIHDGKVHDKAHFDHELYIQPRDADEMLPDGWEESTVPAGMFVKIKPAAGLVEPELHCYRKRIVGNQKNEDTWV